jgi:hypothetical protein
MALGKEERPMEDRRMLWTLGVTSGICWASWIYFLFVFNVGEVVNPWDPWRLVFYGLLLLAPAITFVPIGLRIQWPYLGPFAVISWAAFGYLLTFVNPPAAILTGKQSPLDAWYFFAALLAVLLTLLAPIAYTVGLRLLRSRTHQHDVARAWREAGLLSVYLVGIAIGRSIGLLTWPIALLSLLFLCLVEALFLARKV